MSNFGFYVISSWNSNKEETKIHQLLFSVSSVIHTSTGSGAVTLRVTPPGGWSLACTAPPPVAGLFSKVKATKEPAEKEEWTT